MFSFKRVDYYFANQHYTNGEPVWLYKHGKSFEAATVEQACKIAHCQDWELNFLNSKGQWEWVA